MDRGGAQGGHEGRREADDGNQQPTPAYTLTSVGWMPKTNDVKALETAHARAKDNFCKIHTSLRVTPAMAAGVADRVMDMSDLVTMLVESESEKAA